MDPAPAARRLIRVVIAVSASLSLVFGVVGAASAIRWVQLRDVGVDPGTFTQAVPSGSPAPPTSRCSQHACNYLLLGSDSRAGLPID